MANLETPVSQDFGGIARRKNTGRLWVPASQMHFATGTWTLTIASNLITQVKTAGAETATAYVPFPARFSMGAFQSGSGVVDRGIRPLGVEFLVRVATANLSGVPTIKIFKTPQPVNGGAVPTVAEVTSTTGGDATVTAATTVRRINALIASRDREFLTDTATYHAEVALAAAATTAIAVYGAFWHFEFVED